MHQKISTSFLNLKNILTKQKIQFSLVALCCVLLNMNTLKNEYALDDEMVIGKNSYVLSGFSGIGKILTHDSYQGHFDYMNAANPLQGGRYRPLSLISFAIEQEVFAGSGGKDLVKAKQELIKLKKTSTDYKTIDDTEIKISGLEEESKSETLQIAGLRHGFQIIYFTLSMLVLFYFLATFIFPQNSILALLATLLFVFHPVHTEVIANLKSRDEIFSLLFILLTFIFIFRYDKNSKMSDLIYGLISFVFAFLSKEYAFVVPIIVAVGVIILQKRKLKEVIFSKWFLAVSFITAVFGVIRFNITGTHKISHSKPDILNDPFLFATIQEKIATKIRLLDEYLRLLFFPKNLSSDYSFQHFSYSTFADWRVWLSLLIWTSIIFGTIYLLRKKHIIGFLLLFFLLFFMLVNNIFFGIGATIGERLIYHSSLAFCVIVVWFFNFAFIKIQMQNTLKNLLATFFIVSILFFMGYKTIARNADWKNNFTLYKEDVKTVPNSALVNCNLGNSYFNIGYDLIKSKSKLSLNDSLLMNAYCDTAIPFLNRAITIHPSFVNAYINRALCNLYKGNKIEMVNDCIKANENYTGKNPLVIQFAQLLLREGKEFYVAKEYEKAAQVLNDASLIDHTNAEIWENLGGSEFMLAHFDKASYALSRALELSPTSPQLMQGSKIATNLVILQNKCKSDSLNPAIWNYAAKIYLQANFPTLSIDAYKRVLKLSPQNKEANEGLRNAVKIFKN